jgi:hypothetical protein
VTDTGTAPAAPSGENTSPTLIDVDMYLQVTAGKLRRLADEIEALPAETTLDRFVALDVLKKGAETIVNATKKQTGDRDDGVMAMLMEEFSARGVSSERHAASGRLAHINSRVFPRVAEGYARDYVAQRMRDVDEMAAFVELGFNLNSIRSFFTERIKALEEQRVPITEDALARLIPDELRGLLELVPMPVISVRS